MKPYIGILIAVAFCALVWQCDRWSRQEPERLGASSYVTTPGAPLGWFPPVRAARSSNCALTGCSTTMDSVTVVEGDRVLLFGQTDGTQNGIYIVGVVDGGVAPLVRAPSATLSSQLLTGSMVTVTSGTIWGGTIFALSFTTGADASSDTGIIVGNSSLTWSPKTLGTTAPTTPSTACGVGETRTASGVLYLCSAANTWTVVNARALVPDGATPGYAGELRVAGGILYVCTSTNNWQIAVLQDF